MVSSGWDAFPQTRPEDGWFVIPLADAPSEGIVSAVPVLDAGKPCDFSGEDLSQIAWDFWSMLDPAEPVTAAIEAVR